MRDRRRSWGAARKGVLLQAQNERLLDARALLKAGRWSGAVYLAGYVVECLLKVVILSRGNAVIVTREDRHHDLEHLLQTAHLEQELERPSGREAAQGFALIAAIWDVSIRYTGATVGKQSALAGMAAVEVFRRWLLARL